MLDFLKEHGIEDEVIQDMKNTYSEANLYAFERNEENVIKILDYFKQIGIEYINEILVFEFGTFLNSFEDVKNSFEKIGVQNAVDKINEDYYVIQDIIFSEV